MIMMDRSVYLQQVVAPKSGEATGVVAKTIGVQVLVRGSLGAGIGADLGVHRFARRITVLTGFYRTCVKPTCWSARSRGVTGVGPWYRSSL